MKNGAAEFDSRLAATYYDAQWVFYQIGDYTGDPYWYDCAEAAKSVYRDGYVTPNNGAVPGYWHFTHGLTRHFLSTGDIASQQAVVSLSKNAAYAVDTTPLSWTDDAALSREVAYAMLSYLNAELLGEPHRTRTESLVSQALGHLDQWFVSRSAEQVKPFMFSLTAHALITYQSQRGENGAIAPAITNGANWIWDNCWLPDSKSFKYSNLSLSPGDSDAAPDLNLLIAPIYAWIWHETGNPIFRDRADQIFAGGVTGAYLGNAKQFNQNYRLSFEYVRLRKSTPLR